MNIQYSDYRRFLTSIGLALIILSVTLPWLVLKEPLLVDIKQADLEQFTILGKYSAHLRQFLSLSLSLLACCFSPVFFTAGVSLLIIGLPLWMLREISQERQAYKFQLAEEKRKKSIDLQKKQEATSIETPEAVQHRVKEIIDVIVRQSEISITRIIDAPPSLVYKIISDYKKYHNLILPKKYYKSLIVETGASNSSITVTYQMRVRSLFYLFMGRWKKHEVLIDETEPGKILQEISINDETVKTFIVSSESNGQVSKVTILSQINTSDGWWGSFQRFHAERLYLPVFEEELKQLSLVAVEQNL